jgi:hypothetical protein
VQSVTLVAKVYPTPSTTPVISIYQRLLKLSKSLGLPQDVPTEDLDIEIEEEVTLCD